MPNRIMLCKNNICSSREETFSLKNTKKNNHTDDCNFKFERLQQEHARELAKNIGISLSTKDWENRVKRLHEKNRPSKRKRRNISKIKNKDKDIENDGKFLKGKLVPGAPIDVNSFEGKQVRSPNIYSKLLTDLSEKDINKFYLLLLPVEILKGKNRHYTFVGTSDNLTVNGVIPEVLFAASNDSGFEHYFDVLGEFLIDSQIEYGLFMYAYCEIDDYQKNKVMVTLLDPSSILIETTKNREKDLRLENFVYAYTSGKYYDDDL